jgi:predicted Zn-dependent protease with MMP-like domain
MSFSMTMEDFEYIVTDAITALPPELKDRLDNVEVVVEEWPDPATLQIVGARHRSHLLGFYHGVPQTNRTSHYGMVLPDKISIYRQPILMRCSNEDQVRSLASRVVRHEIAHHFGISDDRLRELGAY